MVTGGLTSRAAASTRCVLHTFCIAAAPGAVRPLPSRPLTNGLGVLLDELFLRYSPGRARGRVVTLNKDKPRASIPNAFFFALLSSAHLPERFHFVFRLPLQDRHISS